MFRVGVNLSLRIYPVSLATEILHDLQNWADNFILLILNSNARNLESLYKLKQWNSFWWEDCKAV